MAGIPQEANPGAQVSLGPFSVFGAGFSALENITQDTVQTHFNDQAKNNDTLKSMSDLVFGGLNAALGLPLSILTALIERLFPGLDLPDSMEEFLNVLRPVPILGDLIELLTGVEDGDESDLGTFFLGLRNALFGIDITNPGSIITAIQAAIDLIVQKLIQPIIDGIVHALTGAQQIGNDVTAIIGSLFNPLQLFNNLLSFVQGIAGGLGGQTGGLDARISALEAQALGASGLVSGDNFNRPAIGSTWTNVTGTLAIGSNDFVKTGNFAAGYYNVDTPDTDQYGVAVKLVARTPGDCALFAFSDTTMSNYVGVMIHAGIFGDDSITLYTGSSPTVTIYRRQVPFVSNFMGHNSIGEGDVIALNYDATTNTYKVSRNGAVIDGLTWEDEDSLITHGPTKRESGIVSCVTNQPLFPGFGITDFVYYDRGN